LKIKEQIVARADHLEIGSRSSAVCHQPSFKQQGKGSTSVQRPLSLAGAPFHPHPYVPCTWERGFTDVIWWISSWLSPRNRIFDLQPSLNGQHRIKTRTTLWVLRNKLAFSFPDLLIYFCPQDQLYVVKRGKSLSFEALINEVWLSSNNL